MVNLQLHTDIPKEFDWATRTQLEMMYISSMINTIWEHLNQWVEEGGLSMWATMDHPKGTYLASKLGVALEVRTLLHTNMMEKNPLSLRMYLHRRKHRLDSQYIQTDRRVVSAGTTSRRAQSISTDKTRYLSYCIIEWPHLLLWGGRRFLQISQYYPWLSLWPCLGSKPQSGKGLRTNHG